MVANGGFDRGLNTLNLCPVGMPERGENTEFRVQGRSPVLPLLIFLVGAMGSAAKIFQRSESSTIHQQRACCGIVDVK